MISNLMAQIGGHTSTDIDEGLFRHMVLNTIRSLRQKYAGYGELIIACDDKRSWRKAVFPYYKANRKKSREQSDIDWTNVFEILNKIKLELKQFFHYRVIQVEGAEADDVIATIVTAHGDLLFRDSEKIVIISGDKDFRQLHRYVNVEQYDPVNKRVIKEDNPEKYLKELIITGDRGDGIPNLLSPDNCLVDGIRQKPIQSKKLAVWLNTEVSEFCNTEELALNWKRNRTLIDLSLTPVIIRDKILEEFESQSNKPKDKIFNYMINNRMNVLIEHINEF
jgi:hypothetical protein